MEVEKRVEKSEQKVDGGGEMMQKESVQNFRESVKEQLEKIAERMVKVTKGNGALVRGMADKKKSVEKIPRKTVRENNLRDELKVMQRVQEEGSDVVKQIDNCNRVEKYNGTRDRPIRI